MTEVAVVPGSHGGFNRIDELNDRIAAFIKAHATGERAPAPTRSQATRTGARHLPAAEQQYAQELASSPR